MAKKNILRVGLVLDDGLDKPDGVQQYVLTLGEWLSVQGHEVRYLVGETTRDDIPGLYSLSKNIGVKSNGNFMTIPLPTSHTQLLSVLATEKFDVLHVQTPYSPFMGGRLIHLASPKTAIIGTFHILPNSWITHHATRLLGFYLQRSIRKFDTMMSVSEAAADFAERTFNIESIVVPNVFDYDRFSSAKPLKKYNDSTKTILFLGRLVPRKGCEALIKAIHLLSDQKDLPKYRVVICGSGPEESKLRHDVKRYGLSDIVEFAGFVEEDEKPKYFASADISVFPSSGGESFGIVLLEALASGRSAVLAGNNSGYRSVMDKQPDLLFDPMDIEMLASRLTNLLEDSNHRDEMAAWGREYSKQFDIKVVGPKIVDIYIKALRKRNEK
ncbi:MAG: glycosyltransferase family 4 protein [Candidatus Saccharimonadales bacterium]